MDGQEGGADPLDALVVSEETIARGQIANVLAPLMRFSKSGDILFEPDFDSLSAVRKVMAVLLALRAMHLLGLRSNPGATPQQIVELSQLPAGTVRPKLSELLKGRLVAKVDGSYSIPTTALRRVASELSGGRNEASRGSD